MVGFDDGSDNEHVLDGVSVVDIHADLSAGDSFVSASPLLENARLCFLGMMKGGPFDIGADVARKMLSAPQNPNGKSNSDVVKRRLIGRDILRRSSLAWPPLKLLFMNFHSNMFSRRFGRAVS
jgi:hypothetical protein